MRTRSRITLGRSIIAGSFGVLLVTALGVGVVSGPSAASAAEGSARPVAVKWAGGNAPDLQQYQPQRPGPDDGTGDYDDLKSLEVSVDRTAALTEGAVTVSYKGMAATGQSDNASYSYLAMMQCWGPDPLAADFAETCQWGGRANSNFQDSISSFASRNLISGQTLDRGLVSFRSVLGGGYGGADPTAQGLKFFGELTSNEVSVARFDSRRAGQVGFEPQNAATAPHLGCGATDLSGAPRRCWLVVVPYGSHSQVADRSDPQFGQPAGSNSGAGYTTPLNPAYTRWNERIVIPLDFEPVGSACPAGSAEIATTGSVLMSKAMASWQRALCGGGLYSLTTNGDDVTRDQLLARKTPFIYTSAPLEASATEAAEADVVYAPVAATGLVVGFKFLTVGGTVTTADITPRLMAKLLTQSYPHQIAGTASAIESDQSATFEHLHWADGLNSQSAFWSDPDVVKAFHTDDPNNPAARHTLAPVPLPQVIGPQTADATAQLWAWIQSDDQARAFLRGEPDYGYRGMTINPYYLPRTSPQAVVSPVYCVNGSPARWNGGPCVDGEKVLDRDGRPISKHVGLDIDLSADRVLTFPKADETLTPYRHQTEGDAPGFTPSGTVRLDALTFPTYANTFEQVAQRVFRGDNARLSNWDKNTFQYKYESPTGPVGTFTIGILDAPTAAAYGLTTARLQVANRPGTFVAPDDVAQAAALRGQKQTDVAGVTRTDLAALPAGAYPLTSIVYAAADVNAPALADRVLRVKYADLIRYAVQDGQRMGIEAGRLPLGYAPLPQGLVTQALAAADQLEAGPKPVTGGDGPPPGDSSAPGGVGAANTPSAAAAPASQTRTSASATPAIDPTSNVVGSTVLGGSLLAGVGGLIAGPLLLRRRTP